jgi:hypothetical protein
MGMATVCKPILRCAAYQPPIFAAGVVVVAPLSIKNLRVVTVYVIHSLARKCAKKREMYIDIDRSGD